MTTVLFMKSQMICLCGIRQIGENYIAFPRNELRFFFLTFEGNGNLF